MAGLADPCSSMNTRAIRCACHAIVVVVSANIGNKNLVERFGANIPLPDLRHEIAKCERRGKMHDACAVRYPDLIAS